MEDPIPAEKVTWFGDVLMELAKRQGFLTQAALAKKIGKKQAYLSMIGSGKRSLTSAIAYELAEVLGCDPQLLLEVAGQLEDGSSLPVTFFTSQITSEKEYSEVIGSRVRRLRRNELIALFGDESIDDVRMFETTQPCWIKNFNRNSIEELTYDTTARHATDASGEVRNFTKGAIKIDPNESLIFKTVEEFHMPSWMEVEVHPPASLAKEFLLTGNGPVIDPISFEGALEILIHNPLDRPFLFKENRPLATLRFSILLPET